MAALFLVFAIAAVAPIASAGYGAHHGDDGGSFSSHHNLEGYPIQTIDLGTFVGKHNLPPNTIRITKTVAVKIPEPYRVNVPRPIPYAVPVPKPYPVEVTKYIKIKEQVPIFVPAPQQQQNQHDSGYSGAYESASSGSNGDGHFGGGYNVGEQSTQGHIAQSYANYLQPSSGVDYQHSAQSADGQYQSQHDAEHAGAEQQEQQYYGHEQAQPQYTVEPAQHNASPVEHVADYSGKQLIYTNPRQGIAAYKVFDGHGNNGYELMQDQHNESPDGTSKSYVSKSEQKLSGGGGNMGEANDYYMKNYKEHVHEVREVHEEGSETSEEQRPGTHQLH